MRTRGVLFATVAVLLLAVAAAHAQVAPRPGTPQTPARDPAGTKRLGTAVITGRVTAADTKRPLRRARVALSGAELAGQGRSANTDNDGRDEIRDLPAGRFTVSVSRSGYLSLQYGQRRVLEQGVALEIADGETIKDIDFVMPRMGVITGRVTDELGDPIANVSVVAMRQRYWDGRRQLVPTGGNIRTDDVGQYRILNLTPGIYYMRATTRETWTVPEGETRRTMGYAPTFFPGVTSAGEAARITVGLGQEVGAIDVSLIPGRAATLSGTAVDSSGRPITNVSLRDEIRGDGFASFSSAGEANVSPNGAFIIRNVPPGEYKLVASNREPERPESIILPISVDGSDQMDLALVGSQGGTVNGRVVTDTGAVPTLPRLRVMLAAPQAGQADPDLIGLYREPGAGTVTADGTFSIKGIFGRSRLRLTLPDGWMMKSIGHDGRDLIDQPIELRGGEVISGVEIVITDKVSTLSGQIVDAKDVTTSDATVIVFADDAARWGEDSRRVRTARPDRQGRYQIKGLPAGEYLVIALDAVENGFWNDPEFLESLRARAQKVSVADTGTHDLPLRRVVAAP